MRENDKLTGRLYEHGRLVENTIVNGHIVQAPHGLMLIITRNYTLA